MSPLLLYHITTLACLNIIGAAGYNLIFGRGKVLYFGMMGHSLIMTYVFWVLMMQFEFAFTSALFITLAVYVATSYGLSWLSLRLDEDAFGVMSIALHLIALSVALNWIDVTRGALGIPQIPRPPFATSPKAFAIFMVILTGIVAYGILRIERSKVGRRITALAEHPWYAQALGVERSTVHHQLFLIGGFCALLVALATPPFLFLLSPIDFGFPFMIFWVLVVVAGGPGSTKGTILSGILIVALVREGMRFIGLPPDLVGPIRLILFGAVLMIATWLRRDKLFPAQRRV